MHARSETIFALSSGAPPAAIAIVRASGPAAADVVKGLGATLPEARRATLAALKDASGALLDRALLLWFPGPDTATGEDLAEFHLHGGRAVVRGVLEAIAALPGCRMAEPGEFTRRAFRNGRIDLAQAEGLADLLQAETEQARVAALRMAEGGLSRKIHGWRVRLLALSADVEAALEFGEELEDEALQTPSFQAAVAALRRELADALQGPPAERLRDGFRVVVAGPPNSGKSTLINVLAEREVAIATPVAGTTRDVLEAPIRIGGAAIVLTDTAGLHETDDAIETIGVARAHAAMAASDLTIWLGAVADAPESALLVHSRNDMPNRLAMPAGYQLAVSARTGAGLQALRAHIVAAAGRFIALDNIALNHRQRALVLEAESALSCAERQGDPILVAEQLRRACAAFDAVVGGSDVESMLDGLFGRFCLGK